MNVLEHHSSPKIEIALIGNIPDTMIDELPPLVEIDEYNFSKSFRSELENKNINKEINATMGQWFSLPSSDTQ